MSKIILSKKGKLVSWENHIGRKLCGIVVETFTFSFFDQKEKEGLYVLSNGKVYKIYEPSNLSIIKDFDSLYNG